MTRFDLPTPDVETQAFWDGCRDGQLLVKHCNACGGDYFYPRPFCPQCWSADVEWKRACGRATLYTYSIVRQNDLPPFHERVPYVTAIVELAEGPRVMTNIRGCDFDVLEIGMPLEVEFRAITDDVTIPVFRPAAAQ
ncbi:MAG: Zn-ribbon domain-containing OB-fold protein [Actinomycetota bacterium]